jgi:hypothetical protein
MEQTTRFSFEGTTPLYGRLNERPYNLSPRAGINLKNNSILAILSQVRSFTSIM